MRLLRYLWAVVGVLAVVWIAGRLLQPVIWPLAGLAVLVSIVAIAAAGPGGFRRR